MQGILSLVSIGRTLARFALPSAGDVIIGSDPSSDIRIADTSVAPRHAALSISGDTFSIRDLGSETGTRVRGVRAGRDGAPVTFDDVISIGATSAVLQVLPGDRGVASPMDKLRGMIERVASATISVLILGETGVGKEVLAETVHRKSSRANAPFLRLNCAALSETLLESELFGYERGAFTGADRTKLGLLETADGGTVFLDEIGELPMATQVKLLRVIEQREVMRVGGLQPRAIDVRFVSATHRDLRSEIHATRFRQDLYFRLNGITISVPPLRDRLPELEALARLFLHRSASALGEGTPQLTSAALDALCRHSWPGNIRELRNVIERAVLLAGGKFIDAEHIVVDGPLAQEGTLSSERDRIIHALSRAAGNQKLAAELLGISRRTLINRLDAYAIARPRKHAL